MPLYQIQAPNGQTYQIEGPDGASQDQVIQAVLAQHPEASKPAQEETGTFGRMARGLEQTISSQRTGLASLMGGNEAAEAGLARQQAIAAKYPGQDDWEAVKKKYEEKGVLPAIGEYISRVPGAVAEQAPQIGESMAAARLGAGAGPYGALAGAAAPSFTQLYGSFLERQAQEQREAGQPVDVNRLKAAAYAVPATAVDVAATFIPMGKGIVKSLFGEEVAKLLTRGATKEAEELAAKELTKESFGKTLGKGLAKGAAYEIPGEVTQQLLERAQAGLPLFNNDALAEYGQTAFSTSMLAPIGGMGRFQEKSAARTMLADEEQKKAAEQRQQEAETEAKRKATPEYMEGFKNDYEALRQQFLNMRSNLNKPGKQGTPDEWAAYKDRQEALKEVSDQLKADAPEYNRIKPILEAQAAQKTEADKQAQIKADLLELSKAPGTQQGLPGFEPTETVNVPPVEVDKNARALELAQQHKEIHGLLEDNQQAQSDAIAKDDFVALDKAIAHREVLQKELDHLQGQLKETGHPIFQEQEAQRISAKLEKAKNDLRNMAGEGLDPDKVIKKRNEIKALEAELAQYGGVPTGFSQKDYAQMGGKSESKASFAARVYKPGPLDVEGQEQDLFDLQRLEDERAVQDAERERKIAPEVNALRRVGSAPAPVFAEGVQRKGQISGAVDKLVDTLFKNEKPVSGRVILGESNAKLDEADSLRAQLVYAQTTNNRTREQEIRKRLQELKEPVDVTSSDLDLGARARAAGIEGRLSPEAMAANRVTRLAQGQLGAFDRLTNFVNNVREGRQDVSQERAQALRGVAERVKDTTLGMALGEIQARRAQAGKPALTTAEQVDAATQLSQILNEAIERGAGLFEQPVTVGEKAQMRANKIVRGATEELRRAPLGSRVFNNYEAAAKSLRAQMRDVIDKASGAEAPAHKERAAAKVQKGEDLLRTQFQGKERTREQQFEAAMARGSEEEVRKLEEIQSKFNSLSPEAQDLAMEQVRRVETGRGLDIGRQLNDELKDLSQARVDEGGQNELFPGNNEKAVTRTTSKRFMNYLNSGEVQNLRHAVEEQARQAAHQAKVAKTLAAKAAEEARKADEFVQKIEAAKNKTPLEKAQAALAKVNPEDSPVQQAIRTAEAIRRQRSQVRQRINGMVEQVQTAHNKAKQHLDETQKLYDYIVQKFLTDPKNQKVNIGLDFYEKALVDAEKNFASTDKALNAAKATQLRVAEDHASDTINNALLNEGEKAERTLQRAKEAVLKAQSDEVKAKNALEKARLEIPKEPKAPTLREQVEAAPVSRTLRSVRDTSDPAVQREVNKLKGMIAKNETEYDAAVAAKDMDEAKRIADLIEDNYNTIYDKLNEAPRKTTDTLSAAEEKAMQEFEDAQIALANATNAMFRQKAGLPALGLTKRRAEGVVRTKRGAVQTAIKEPSVAQQEREAKAAPKAVLEKIAEKRAEIKAVEDQLAYIAEHPSATKEGKAKQRAAKAAANEKRAKLREELKALATEQAAAVSESKQTKKEKKQIRKVGKEFIRADTAAAKAIDEGDLFATETTSAPQVQLSDVAKEALRDGRILDALDDLAQNGSLPFIRENAAAIRKLVSRTRVVITDDIEVDGKQVPAAYNANENVILMKPDALTESNLIHEGTHAATMRGFEGPEDKLNADQLAAKRELTKMFEDLTADGTLTGEYAANNVKEFASEVQSNAALRDKLDNRSMLRKFFDSVLRFIGMTPKATRTEEAQRLIERLYMQSGKVAAKTAPVGAATYVSDDMKSVGNIADKFVAKNKGTWENIKAAAGGWLGAETMLVDRFAALERVSKVMDALKGSQMMYYARMFDQRMNFVSQAVEHGAPQIVEKTRKDGQVERVIEAKEGPNIKGAVNILKEANKHVGNGEAVNRIFTLYMSAIRAKEKGFNTLHFGKDLTEADLNEAYRTVSANKELKDIFDRARNEYNEYNRNMLEFLVHSGAISKSTARALMANNDYIPWYRERNGVAEMVIGNETPIRIGSIKEQPHLQELIGGDQAILDFMTSSVQNTSMLTDMALRNLATKNAVYEMMDVGAARIVRKAEGPNVVKFKDKGEEKIAVVDGLPGIPGDLIVKGMEGIPTQLPALVRVMAAPSKLLRKAVTLSPLYMAKQLFRDSLAAPIMNGANFTPVIGALKQIGSPNKETLERRGIVGGQMLTGTNEDITKILRDIGSDKTHWLQGLAKIEAMGMEADALSRRAQYQSYLEQGLSEMEATLASLESMNFNKRGASPSVHWVNSMIPFFNAQIQGLNVLYKALTGKMPFNDRLKIQEKMLQRGAMMAAMTFAYAAAMQDDEAYKNATPDQKYGNWFFRIPGVDEPVRIPVPFEVGYIFKALPEALYNSMVNEHGSEEAVEAFKQILLQTIPGGTSYGIPQAVKPGVEAILGKSFYTGRDILSEHEKRFLPSEQYRDNTTEIAKIIGSATNTSPIMLEELVRGYTGTMGLAMLQAVSLPFTRQGPEQAVKRLSDLPVVGSAFQPNDAGGIINNMYEQMQEAKKVEATYMKMMEEGRQAEANALLQQRGNEFMQSQMADWFTTQMGDITKAERAIKASDMTPQEKRKELDDLRQLKIKLAATVREVSDETKRQALQP